MVSAHGGGRSSLGEDAGAPPVRGDPGAGRARLVNRAPDQRMAEAEPPGHLRGTHEVPRDQLVERVERFRLGHVGGRRREVELERVAGHRGRLGEATAGR